MTARLLFVAGALGLLGLGALLTLGWDYYSLPSVQRPMHPMHGDLRSSGNAGLACGIGAAALFLLNLSYLLRKRLARMAWLGNLRAWMDFHVFTGVLGAGCAVAHSAMQPSSSLGQAALAGLGVVVVTGLIGRYIYAHVPRTLRGREMEGEELRQRLKEHRARLLAMGVGDQLLEVSPSPASGRDSLLGRIAGVIAGDREIRREYARLRRSLKGNPDLARILPVARRFCRDQQFLARYGELRGLMSSWRFLHRWLAVVLILVVAAHVAIALRFGDLL